MFYWDSNTCLDFNPQISDILHNVVAPVLGNDTTKYTFDILQKSAYTILN